MVGVGATVGSTHGVVISVDYGMNGPENSSTMWFNVGPPMIGVFLVSFMLLVSDRPNVVCLHKKTRKLLMNLPQSVFFLDS